MNLVMALALLAAGHAAAAAPGGGAPPAEPPKCELDLPEDDPATAGLLYSAAGFDHLRSDGAEHARIAVACLREAQKRLPESAVVQRDLATAYARLGQWTEAATAIQAARRLGAAGPELELLAAVVASYRGDSQSALEAAQAEGSWRGDLIATRYGSSGAKDRLINLLPEPTRRGTWSHLVLAMVESSDGDLPAARTLAAAAEQQADLLGFSALAGAARRLSTQYMQDASGWQGTLRLRSALEYASNPGLQSIEGVPRGAPFRLALTAEGGLARSFGRLTASAALRVDQHLFLTQRSELDRLDIFRWSVATGLRYPLSSDPNGTALGLVARFVDVYGDRFGEHLGRGIEGGPELHIRVAGNLQARLGLYGLKTDFIDRSPPTGLLSAVDRDRVGQRALLTFRYRSRRFDIAGDAMFLRDRAEGEAFDAIGGGLGFRATVLAGPGLWLRTGLTGTLREYGPVGDAAIIGDAATRTEFRTAATLGARWALSERLSAVGENIWISTAARDRHRYTNNVLTLGLEAQW